MASQITGDWTFCSGASSGKQERRSISPRHSVSGIHRWHRTRYAVDFHFVAAILQTTFSNVFPSMELFEFRSKFQWRLFPRVQLHRPQLVVHAVYHYERCSRCGQLDVKYSGKVDISVDKILLFKLFFLGLFSVCLPNIYFNMLEYLSTLDLLSFDKSDL